MTWAQNVCTPGSRSKIVGLCDEQSCSSAGCLADPLVRNGWEAYRWDRSKGGEAEFWSALPS